MDGLLDVVLIPVPYKCLTQTCSGLDKKNICSNGHYFMSAKFDLGHCSSEPRATLRRIIIHMKKLLDSDWLRAVHFKCNTSAKSVTPVQKV